MQSYFYTYNVIFDAPVSGGAKLVYAYLCKCANDAGKCWPSHKTIGNAAGIGVTTVKKALAELESAGLVAVRGQARPDCGRRANLYTVVKEAVKGFFVTYANVFVQTLTAKARLVYLYFCRLASGRDTAFPAHKTTAQACGLSVAGTRAAIDELEAAGLVERQAQYRDNGGQRSNLYTLVTVTPDKDAETTPAETVRDAENNQAEQAKTITPNADTRERESIGEVSASAERKPFCVVKPCTGAPPHTHSHCTAPRIAAIKQPPVPRNGQRNLIYNEKYP